MKHNEFDNAFEFVFMAVNSGFTVRDQEGDQECGDLCRAKVIVAEDNGEPTGRFFVDNDFPRGWGFLFPTPEAYREYLIS